MVTAASSPALGGAHVGLSGIGQVSGVGSNCNALMRLKSSAIWGAVGDASVCAVTMPRPGLPALVCLALSADT